MGIGPTFNIQTVVLSELLTMMRIVHFSGAKCGSSWISVSFVSSSYNDLHKRPTMIHRKLKREREREREREICLVCTRVCQLASTV